MPTTATNPPPAIVRAPLCELYVAPENGRGRRDAEHVEALAENIAAYGLLSPLVAYTTTESGVWMVVDGRRRLAALRSLDSAGRLPDALRASVPIHPIERDQARGAGLSANTLREAMHPADEARAFALMISAESGEADVAAIANTARAFGTTERHVRQRLRLAGLAPVVFDALAEGRISLDVAQAFAIVDDQERQRAVFERYGSLRHISPYNVRRELTLGSLPASTKTALFVGEAAYVAAGGRIERDLFGAEDEACWLDVALAERLAAEKLAGERARCEAEGWSWVEASLERAWPKGATEHRDPPRRAPSKGEAARLKAIEQELARGRARMAEIDDIDADAVSDQENDLLLKEQEELDERENALLAEQRRIEAGLIEWTAEHRAQLGAFVAVDDDGRVIISRGLRRAGETVTTTSRKTLKGPSAAPSSPGAAPGAESAEGGAPASPALGAPAAPVSDIPAPPEEPRLTRAQEDRLRAIAARCVGAAMLAEPRLALAALAARLLRTDQWGGAEIVALGGTPHWAVRSDADAGGQLHKRQEKLRAAYRAQAGGADLERALAVLTVPELATIIAPLIAGLLALDGAALEQRAERLAALGAAAGATLDPARHWLPDEPFFKGMNKAALAEAAALLGVDLKASWTKAAIAARLTDAATRQRWVPPQLAALTGWTPAAAAEPTPLEAALGAAPVDPPKPKRGRPPKANAAKASAPKPRIAGWTPLEAALGAAPVDPPKPKRGWPPKANAAKASAPKPRIAGSVRTFRKLAKTVYPVVTHGGDE